MGDVILEIKSVRFTLVSASQAERCYQSLTSAIRPAQVLSPIPVLPRNVQAPSAASPSAPARSLFEYFALLAHPLRPPLSEMSSRSRRRGEQACPPKRIAGEKGIEPKTGRFAAFPVCDRATLGAPHWFLPTFLNSMPLAWEFNSWGYRG